MSNSGPPPPSPADLGDRTVASVDSATERWRAALATSSAPAIEKFLPAVGDPKRRQALVALISAELDVRIRRNESCRVEQFAKHQDELQPRDILSLIVAELRARQRTGESVKGREYARRFPSQYEALKKLIANTGSTVSRKAPRRPHSLKPGQRLGDYEILLRLGAGSYADVYLARQTSLGRDVAVKVSVGAKKEAQTLAKLDHPNIVQVLSEHDVAGHHLLVMRYVPGRMLDEWIEHQIEQPKPLQGRQLLQWLRAEGEPNERARDDREAIIADKPMPEVATHIFLDLAKALTHAHHRGVLHLDIKPSNILLDMDGRGLLTDFNVAATPDDGGIQRPRPTGGTLAYMPPEQLAYFAKETAISAEQIDTRTDLYSLGVVMFELLSGRSPWPVPKNASNEVMARQLLAYRMQPPAPLSSLPTSVDSSLAGIVDRLLHPSPDQRYQTASSLAEDLKHWLASEPVQHDDVATATKTRPGRFQKSLVVATTVMLAVAVTAVAATFRWKKANAVPDRSVVAEEHKTDAVQPIIDHPHGDGASDTVVDKLANHARPIANALRPTRRTPLSQHLRKAVSTDTPNWELAINPLALHGVDIPDNWERRYARQLRQSESKYQVVSDVVMEVLLVQLVVHGEKNENLEDRFFSRIPRKHLRLPLVRTLRSELEDKSISDVTTSSLLVNIGSEFERYLLGIVAALRDDYDAAMSLLRRARRENADRHTASYYYGLCAERVGKTEEAKRAYLRCQQDQPHFVPAYRSLGELYARQGKTGLAIEQFRLGVQQAPNSTELPMALAQILLRGRHPEQAVKILDRMLEDPKKRTPATLTRRATAKVAAGDYPGARADLEAALEIDPNFPQAKRKLRALDTSQTRD